MNAPLPVRGSLTAAAAGFTAFVNIYSLQSLLPVLAQAFQSDDSSVSLAVSATTLAVALAAPAAGWLASRTTRANLVKISVGGLVVAGLNVAAASSLNGLILWRFVQGLFLPVLITGVLSFIAEDFPREQVGRATSNYVTWTIVGGFAGRWLGGTVGAAFGWRQALLFLALTNALSGLVLLLSLSHPRARIKGARCGHPRDFARTLSEPALRSAYLIGFGSLFTLVGTFTFVTFHLAQAFAMGPEGLGRVFCVYLLGIAVTPMVGRALPRLGPHRTVKTSASLALVGLSLTLLPHLVLVVCGLSLICVAAFVTQASVSTFIAQLGPERKTLAAGLYISFYYFGGSLGAALPGLAWRGCGWLGCVLMLMAAQILIRRLSRNL